LSLAGNKALRIYSLGEAHGYFDAALAILEKSDECASDDQLADFLVGFSLLLNMSLQINKLLRVVERYLSRLNGLNNYPRLIVVRHHYTFALQWNTRFKDAISAQVETVRTADSIAQVGLEAYMLTPEIFLDAVIVPRPIDEF